MKLKSLLLLLCTLLLSGCLVIVPKSRLNNAVTRSSELEREVQSQNLELAKGNKRIQELEATNRSLTSELTRAKNQVAEKEKELRENQAMMETLLKQMKTIR